LVNTDQGFIQHTEAIKRLLNKSASSKRKVTE